MRVHHLNNVSRALEVLKEQNVRLVNISNNDIVDGNAKITLALAWTVFLHWQVKTSIYFPNLCIRCEHFEYAIYFFAGKRHHERIDGIHASKQFGESFTRLVPIEHKGL